MKRFAYVCADAGIPLPGSKGASVHVASVVQALVRAGLTGEVYSTRAREPALCGVPLRPIPMPPGVGDESPADREQRLFLAGLGSAVASAPPYDFLYERYSLWHAGGLARSRALGVPFVLEVNSPLPEEARRYRSLVHEKLAEGLAELLLRHADGVVCVSDAVAEWVARRRGRDAGVWVVPNGVDPELFSPHARRDSPTPWAEDGAPVVVFSGSFRPWHGLDDLLEAFRLLVRDHVPQARLLCVGDGPQRESFERQLDESGLADRVHFTGNLPQREVPRCLAAADVAVAPYPKLEHFYYSPLKLYEFLALGLPVVAADVGQVREVLGDSERGLLYPPGEARLLAEAIANLLTDRPRASRLGDAGRAWVLSVATWAKRVELILERIAELGGRRSSGEGTSS